MSKKHTSILLAPLRIQFNALDVGPRETTYMHTQELVSLLNTRVVETYDSWESKRKEREKERGRTKKTLTDRGGPSIMG